MAQTPTEPASRETRQGAASKADRFIDPKTLMTIRNLELRARLVVEGFRTGLHRSPFHGFSVEFTEYRQYAQGDDLRFLDWRVYGRSDRFYIKKYEDETNLRCHLIVDASSSMQYGSKGYSKADYASTFAATLGHFLLGQGDAVGALIFDEDVRDYLPARNRPGHVRRLMLLLEKGRKSSSTDLIAPLKKALEIVKRRGLFVYLSDLLAPVERLQLNLGALMGAGHDCAVVQVLDPEELDFVMSDQPIVFKELESGREIYIDPSQARDSYLKRLRAHNAQVKQICDRLGASYFQARTDRPMETLLADFVQDQGRRRGRPLRRERR